MANQKNIDIVASLKDKLSKANSVVLADYRGLTHKQAEELHRNVKKVGGEFVVAKNSLLKIAGGWQLKDPTAALFAYEDELAPLKELAKVIKNLGLPKIKIGIINNKEYTAEEVTMIAKLPGQDVLRAQVVGQLNSPIYDLAATLRANLQKLVFVLEGVKNRV